MKFTDLFIDSYINESSEPVTLHERARLHPGARIFKSTLQGPLFLNRNTQLGPNITIGKYSGMNESGYAARGTIGAFCAFGARTAINPFNHPIDWLSTHEFQYMPTSYDWIAEYRDLERLSRTPDMLPSVTIGNDVWTGHNVNIMGKLTIGDGVIIGAGSVVTKDVPPFAIVAGAPATVRRMRFPDRTIERLLAARWWDLELSELSAVPFRDIERALDRVEEIRAKRPATQK